MIYIVGSNGYIGRNLIKILNHRKIESIGFGSGHEIVFKEEIKENEFNTLYWCAAKVNPVSASNSELRNSEFEAFVSTLCKFYDANLLNCKIIFLSSGGCVYTGKDTVFSEISETKAVNEYGRLKLKQEMFLQNLGLPYQILRISNIFGGNQPHGRGQGVIAEWIYAVKKNVPLKVFGDLNSYRDYLHLEDLINALVKLHKIDSTGVFNLGSSSPTTLSEIISIFKSAAAKELFFEYFPERITDRYGFVLDNSKIRNLIDWEPKESFKVSLLKELNNAFE